MLNVMRDNLRSLKWVLWAVAASMVLYLGAFFSCDDGGSGGVASDWAARVDGVSIGTNQFRDAARNLDQQYSGMFGEQWQELRPRMRIGTQVIQTLIVDELIRQDAQRMGLSVGAEELAHAIRNDTRLHQDGKFVGQEIYNDSLQRYPGGVAGYESDMSSDLMLQKWDDLMTQSVHVSDMELEELHRDRTEKTAVSFVLVAAADQEVDETIDTSELQAWYDGHLEDYRRDPGRSIRALSLERDHYAETLEVSEAEIRASYEANRTRYSHGTQRRARHILLKVEDGSSDEQRAEVKARAEEILARVQSGEPFEPLAQTVSEDPISAARGGDLEFFERERMVEAFADAAFNTAVGQFAPLTETQFGFHVIQVTDAREAGTTPLENVREEIELRLRARRTQEKVSSEADRVAGLVTSGDNFDSVAASEGLQVESRFVSRNDPLVDLGVRPDFLDRVFDLEVGAVSAPMDSRAGKLIVTVDEIAPSEIAPLAEVETSAREDVLADRRRSKALDEARKAASGDWSLERVATRLGLTVEESGDLAPGTPIPSTGGMTDELHEALFGPAVVVGDQGVVDVPSGAVVYNVSRREPFDAAAFSDARPSLLQELTDNRRAAIRESILTQLRGQVTVEVNQALITQIDGLQ